MQVFGAMSMDVPEGPGFGRSLMTGEAFERFVREHERMVRALARSAVRDADAAEDVVQETFWRAWRSLDGLADPSRAKAWVAEIARHAALDHLRSRRRRPAEELKVDVAAPERKEEGDLVERVMRAVDALRADYRQILILRHVEKLSYKEVAQALGMTPGAVGEKLNRVRKMVAERFAR